MGFAKNGQVLALNVLWMAVELELVGTAAGVVLFGKDQGIFYNMGFIWSSWAFMGFHQSYGETYRWCYCDTLWSLNVAGKSHN